MSKTSGVQMRRHHRRGDVCVRVVMQNVEVSSHFSSILWPFATTPPLSRWLKALEVIIIKYARKEYGFSNWIHFELVPPHKLSSSRDKTGTWCGSLTSSLCTRCGLFNLTGSMTKRSSFAHGALGEQTEAGNRGESLTDGKSGLTMRQGESGCWRKHSLWTAWYSLLHRPCTRLTCVCVCTCM